jgi:hypothetical protein
VDLLQFQHFHSELMGLCAAAIKKAAAIFRRRPGGGEYCYPITDSKEPGVRGQRREAGFLWIREAGIPLLGNSPESHAKLGLFKGFYGGFFAQAAEYGAAQFCVPLGLTARRNCLPGLQNSLVRCDYILI